MSQTQEERELEDFIRSLASGHDDLGARMRTLVHSINGSRAEVKLHAHYLAFRHGQPTISEFVEILYLKLVPFCLHRRLINQAQQGWSNLPANKIQESAVSLHKQALDLFKKANKNTNRNGEFGELITYLLIESVLKAPQFVAKMSLKTSPQMPVHGSDGIHVSFHSDTNTLRLLWGESKCYSNVGKAIERAAVSISENLTQSKMAHELFLIEHNFDLSGFPEDYREAILSFLNPFDENYNKRQDVSVVFIAFDFKAFEQLQGIAPEAVEQVFCEKLAHELAKYSSTFEAALSDNLVQPHSIELFFLPLPSVEDFRTQFQSRIGWAN